MAGPDPDTLSGLMDESKCFALVRRHRWPDGVRCPACDSRAVTRDGRDETQPQRQRYRCKSCAGRFDDLTGTVLAGHHQPLRVWVLVLYLMGLNLSNEQIAQELDLDPDDAQRMTSLLREGIVRRKAGHGYRFTPCTHGYPMYAGRGKRAVFSRVPTHFRPESPRSRRKTLCFQCGGCPGHAQMCLLTANSGLTRPSCS